MLLFLPFLKLLAVLITRALNSEGADLGFNQTFLTDPAKLEGGCAHIMLGHPARFSRLKCADVLNMIRQSSSHGEGTLHLGDKAGML